MYNRVSYGFIYADTAANLSVWQQILDSLKPGSSDSIIDDVWEAARTSAEMPHFGNLCQDIVLGRLKDVLLQLRPDWQIDYCVNAVATDFSVNGTCICDGGQIDEMLAARPDVGWGFVTDHYPDYRRCPLIGRQYDMDACLSAGIVDSCLLVTEETVRLLKEGAGQAGLTAEQTTAFDFYIDSGLSFGEAEEDAEDYCIARAIACCTLDLPEYYRSWADAVLREH